MEPRSYILTPRDKEFLRALAINENALHQSKTFFGKKFCFEDGGK